MDQFERLAANVLRQAGIRHNRLVDAQTELDAANKAKLRAEQRIELATAKLTGLQGEYDAKRAQLAKLDDSTPDDLDAKIQARGRELLFERKSATQTGEPIEGQTEIDTEVSGEVGTEPTDETPAPDATPEVDAPAETSTGSRRGRGRATVSA